jgi:two-component system cell cycle sensor histidine kinase/response regulator CckA
MKRRSKGPDDWETLRRKVMGLGERSFHKSYYPELQKRIAELERFRSLLDESGNAIFLAEVPSGKLVDVNAMVQVLTGFPREEVLGERLGRLFSPEVSPELDRLLADDARRDAGAVSLTTKLATRRGPGVPVELNLRLVSFGRKPYAVVIAHDITTRQQAQQELIRSKEDWERTFDAVPDLVALIDTEHRIIRANKALMDRLGLDASRVIGRRCHALVHGLSLPPEFCPHAKLIRDGREHRVDVVEPKLDGAFEVSCSPIRSPEGRLLGSVHIMRDITERRRAEEEIVKERNLSHGMIDSLPGVFYLFDLEGRFLRWNKAFETVSGYSAAEIERLHPVEFFRGADRELIADRIRRAIEIGVADAEAEFVSKDGRATPHYFTGRRIELDGRPCVIGMGIDITERVRAERALRESEEKHRFLTENMADIIWTLDRDFRTTYVSPSIEKVLGFTPEERVRQKVEDMITPESYQRIMARFLDELRREGEPGADPDRTVTLETEYYRRDGSTVWMENQVQALRDHTGAMVGVYGVSRDVTKRKRAEEDLARARDLFEAVFQHHPNPLLLVRRDDGLVRMVNLAFEREWGYRQAEVAGRSARTFYADPASRDEMLDRLAQEGSLRYFESLGQKGDGSTAPVVLSVEQVDIAGEAHLIVAAQDVTERKLEEEEKARLETQLRQAQKLEAIGRLAGGMAHDFNNLLAVIMGYSRLVLQRLPADAPFRQELEAIDQAGDRAASLIRQLLAFSRRQILQPKVIDLNRLVSDTEQMLRRLIGEDIDLATVLEPNLGRVLADPGQIEQLIVNLAVNARDAIEGIGRVTIETANVYLDEAYCREHTDASPGHHVMLALSDTGQGMDEDTKSKIFDPFFTTKDPDKGTGLGLATVYGIVKQSGGNIYVYSEPGQGTTFKVYLPVVQDQETALPSESEDESFPRGEETVLVVEDEDGVRNFILDVLRYAGYTALEARHGEEALEVCRASREPIHLVITDVVMPRMSGRQLGQMLAEIRPETRVLFMSGYTDNAIVHHGLLDQGVNFIAKPFTPAGLARKIRDVLDRRD